MAEAPGDPTAVKQDDLGKWSDAKGDPTYKIEPDGQPRLVRLFRISAAITPNATSATARTPKARPMRQRSKTR